MLNKIMLIGRLVKDPELRATTQGTSVASFTLAVNRPKIKDKEQETDFINCVAWRGQADNLCKYQTKGNLIAVEGRLQVRTYEDKDGKKVWVTEVLAENIQYLESKKNNEVPQEVEEKSDPFAEFGESIADDFDEDELELPF
jgi:single-strand DNA-binding protein